MISSDSVYYYLFYGIILLSLFKNEKPTSNNPISNHEATVKKYVIILA